MFFAWPKAMFKRLHPFNFCNDESLKVKTEIKNNNPYRFLTSATYHVLWLDWKVQCLHLPSHL
jgi:hypothetical protein